MLVIEIQSRKNKTLNEAEPVAAASGEEEEGWLQTLGTWLESPTGSAIKAWVAEWLIDEIAESWGLPKDTLIYQAMKKTIVHIEEEDWQTLVMSDDELSQMAVCESIGDNFVRAIAEIVFIELKEELGSIVNVEKGPLALVAVAISKAIELGGRSLLRGREMKRLSKEIANAICKIDIRGAVKEQYGSLGKLGKVFGFEE